MSSRQKICFSPSAPKKKKYTTYKRETQERVPYVNLNTLFSYTACEGSINPELSLSLSFSPQKNNTEKNWPATRSAQPPSACHIIGIINMISVRPSICPVSFLLCDRSQMQKGARNELPPQIIFCSLRSQEKETHYVQERNTRKSTLHKSKYIIFIHSLRRVHRPGALSLSLSLSLTLSRQWAPDPAGLGRSALK